MTFGQGDALQVMTPESIRTIGLYDERFCNIGYQEGDYFQRARILNNEKSSINDFTHLRLLNVVPNTVLENVNVVVNVEISYLIKVLNIIQYHIMCIVISGEPQIYMALWSVGMIIYLQLLENNL